MLVARVECREAYNTQDNHIEQGLPGHKVQVTLCVLPHSRLRVADRLLEGVFYGEANNGKKRSSEAHCQYADQSHHGQPPGLS